MFSISPRHPGGGGGFFQTLLIYLNFKIPAVSHFIQLLSFLLQPSMYFLSAPVTCTFLIIEE